MRMLKASGKQSSLWCRSGRVVASVHKCADINKIQYIGLIVILLQVQNTLVKPTNICLDSVIL